MDDPWHSSHGIMDIMDIMAARYGASDFIGRHDDQALVPFFGSWSAPELSYSCCVSNMFKEFTAQELHISSEKELGTRDTSPLALTIWFRHDPHTTHCKGVQHSAGFLQLFPYQDDSTVYSRTVAAIWYLTKERWGFQYLWSEQDHDFLSRKSSVFIVDLVIILLIYG